MLLQNNQRSINHPLITAGAYRRFIFEASQSYWRPALNYDSDADDVFDMGTIQAGLDFSANSSDFSILSGSNITGSYPVFDSTNSYPAYGARYNTVPF